MIVNGIRNDSLAGGADGTNENNNNMLHPGVTGRTRVSVLGFICPLPPRRAALKERCCLVYMNLAVLPPARAMLDNPVGQSPLKPDVMTGLFRLYPLMLEDFLAFRLKFAV